MSRPRRKTLRGLPQIVQVDESPSELEELIKQTAKEAERARHEFGSDLASFERLLQRGDPRLLLASLSFYRLTTNERRIREHEPESQFSQHHVELIQAFCLRQPLQAFEQAPPDGEMLAEVSTAIQELVTASVLRRLPLGDDDSAFTERQFELVRLHTLGVRNWGQPFQVERVFDGLFRPLETDIRLRFGVSVTALAHMSFAALALIEKRISAHRRRFRPVLRAPSLAHAAARLLDELPSLRQLEGRLASIVSRAAQGEISDDPMWLLPYTEPYLYDVYSLTVDELLLLYPGTVEREALEAVLEAWSLGFGDTAAYDPERLFLDNPIWTAPLIDLQDRYFWPVVTLFQSFAFELVEKVLKRDLVLWERYLKRRGKFLEEEVAAQLAAALPQGEIVRNAGWTDSAGGHHESDVIALLDGAVVVAECKAGRVDPAARRGAPSLREELNKTVVDGARQADAVLGELQARSSPLVFQSRGQATCQVDPAAVERSQKVIVTLELLGPWARIRDLRRAGLVPADFDGPPSIALADLQLATELLDGPSQLLHYLEWREGWENVQALYDEHDLIACYLIARDLIGHFSPGGNYNITHLSSMLEPYFLERWFDRHSAPPAVRLTAWWRATIAKLESKRPRRWSQITAALLAFDYADQRAFTRQLNEALYRQRRGLATHAVEAIYAGTASAPRTALVGVAFGRNASRAAIDETYRRAMAEALDELTAERVAMVARADHLAPDEPFIMAGYFERSELRE